MADPFVGEIRMFGGNFAPLDWAICQGQLLPIDQYQALFTLIGTTYGGDGVNTFGLPDLRGRVPVHVGTGQSITYVLGQQAGTEQVTLTAATNPPHTHVVSAQNSASATTPANGVYAGGSTSIYRPAPASTMNAAMVGFNTGGQPHENLMPYLVINFIISLFGIFPTQN